MHRHYKRDFYGPLGPWRLECTEKMLFEASTEYQNDAGSSIATLLIRGPQGQVITQQLHDERRVLVRIFRHVVQLGNGILESSASHLACLVWVAQNFVMEDREVEGQTQPDGVSHCKLAGSTHCIIICHLGFVCSTSLLPQDEGRLLSVEDWYCKLAG